MKSIYNVIPDIYALVQTKGWLSDVLAHSLSEAISNRFKSRFGEGVQDTYRPTLRLSRMGPVCPRQLWYSIHRPEMGEAIPPWATIKYSYGDILEALVIVLVKAAGHEVTGEQDELRLDGIVGHRDCVIDGCLVDIKSASSRAFIKFKNKTLHQDDSFGYLDQLDGYCTASVDDPLVRVKDKAYILAIDKQLGHMALYEHTIRTDHIKSRIARFKEIVGRSTPPDCDCKVVSDGASGNIKLGTAASYSSFKHCCFPLLRTFAYAAGPVYLTKVVRTPDVPEIFRRTNDTKTTDGERLEVRKNF